MTSRVPVLLLAASGLLAMGVVAKCPPPAPQSEVVSLAGFPEPHTPGSGAPEEMAATVPVQRLLGATPDLNRVTYRRTFLPKPSGAPPRAIVILVPGFLGGANNFTPLAEQLVRRFNGNLEVWAVDRRPNQLEDRRGTLYGRTRLEANDVDGYLDALQFYFPDTLTGANPFPTNPTDSDVNQNGVQDPPFALPDALGGSTPFQQLTTNDARFAAHWGIDTYARDWKLLVDAARSVVGPTGLVLFGGHSAGTSFSGIFAAYDFDPGPGVDAAHDHIDGLLLLEGGGPGAGGTTVTFQQNGMNLPAVPRPNSTASYDALVAQLAANGGPDVFLPSFFNIPLAQLGAGAELVGLDGQYHPGQASLAQRTSLLKSGTLFFLLGTPMTAEMPIGIFIDDDFSPVAMLSGSYGFSDNGPNSLFVLFGNYLIASPPGGGLRTWKNFDDPTLPTCPPNDPDPAVDGGPGCAILDRGPRPGPTDPPARWGITAEPSDLYALVRNQLGGTNFLEWYYLSGRITLDLAYGRDSSSLGDESRLAVTQNATMDKPVLCIGASNGLAPTEASFAGYLSSIATPSADQEIHISEGYAHLDPLTAADNDAVPVIADWVNRLLQRKLLGGL
jgi:pimeloyl-ACP methyl ester carboxylesterase